MVNLPVSKLYPGEHTSSYLIEMKIQFNLPSCKNSFYLQSVAELEGAGGGLPLNSNTKNVVGKLVGHFIAWKQLSGNYCRVLPLLVSSYERFLIELNTCIVQLNNLKMRQFVTSSIKVAFVCRQSYGVTSYILLFQQQFCSTYVIY